MHSILPQIYRVFSIFATLILSLSLAFTLASSVSGFSVPLKGLPDAGEVCKGGKQAGCGFIQKSDNPAALAANIAQILTYIIGAIAIVFMLYGAFQYMTGGDKGPEVGKKMIINSIIALVISVAAYGVVSTIIYFLTTTTVGGPEQQQ